MSPQEMFVARLRRHRLRNGITLDEIAAATRVKPELFEALENNDLAEWPRGLYARAWVRGYANAVGLDPMDTVDEFCRLFRHGDRRAQPTLKEMAVIVSEPSQYRDEFSHPDDRRRPVGTAAQKSPRAAWPTGLGQVARAVWARLINLASLHLRPGRAPHGVAK